MARLSELPRRDRERSSRVNEVWRPLGLHHELRLVFRVEGVCWGAAGTVRMADFTDREVEFLTAVAPALACATRVAACAGGGGPERPAIVVVTANGEVRAATAAAREWRDELDDIAPGRFTVMVRAVVSGARAAPSGTFGARVRGSRGGWILLRAARLVSDDDETAVTLERASGDALVDLLFAAYGLTSRERGAAARCSPERPLWTSRRRSGSRRTRCRTTSRPSSPRPACGAGESRRPASGASAIRRLRYAVRLVKPTGVEVS